jgi:hypothetical protein
MSYFIIKNNIVSTHIHINTLCIHSNICFKQYYVYINDIIVYICTLLNSLYIYYIYTYNCISTGQTDFEDMDATLATISMSLQVVAGQSLKLRDAHGSVLYCVYPNLSTGIYRECSQGNY